MTNWIDYRTARPLQYPRRSNAAFPEQAIVTLSAQEREALNDMVLTIPANPYVREEQECFIASTREAFVRALAEKTLRRINDELEFGLGAVLVTGLPIDSKIPKTPSSGGTLAPDYKRTFVSESVLLGLGSLTGAEPFNFRQEGRGSAPLIDNIVPVRELRGAKGAGGYENNFPFHCESAWHRKRPDYLVLLGIRESPTAKTLVYSTQMLEAVGELLSDPAFDSPYRLKAPDLYVQMEELGIPMGTSRYVLTQPVHGPATRRKLNINFNGTDCCNEAAVKWLARLESHVESAAVAAVLSPGNAIILNNDLTCHTRTGYSPAFKGKDRWFLRGYFKKNLWAQDAVLAEDGSRVCDESDFDKLIELGWMTCERRLTPRFFEYVWQPERAKALGGLEARLASIAFHFTPADATRIV